MMFYHNNQTTEIWAIVLKNIRGNDKLVFINLRNYAVCLIINISTYS